MINKVHFTSDTARNTQKKINDNFDDLDGRVEVVEAKTTTSAFTNDGSGTEYEAYAGYTGFSSTSDYVGYYVLVSTTYTKVTSSNKDSLSIVAGTTVAYQFSPYATREYVKENGGKIDSISVNNVAQTIDANKNVDITVPTTASDVGALPDSTKYGKSLSVSGTSVSLKDQDGTVLSTITTQDTNDNQTIKTSSVTFGANDAVQITAGTNVTVTGNASEKTITIASSYTDTNTWRPVKLNGTEKLNNSTAGNALDLKAGTNISITESDGEFTFAVTGLSSAMQFIGVSTTDPKSNSGATVSGHSTWAKGEVVVYKRGTESGYEEYINLDGSNVASSWELLGDADDYALKTISVSAGTGLTGGGTLEQNRTISLADAYGDTKNPYGTKAKNTVLAGPDGTTGHTADAVPSFRALVAGDIPDLSGTYMTKSNPTGIGSLSINRKENTTIGTNSVAVGNNNTASGNYSFAEGKDNIASRDNSHAEGLSTTASGVASHAEGSGTTASGMYAHAEGQETTASGYASHAEGLSTTSSGDNSHAEGEYTTAQRKSQHAFGEYNILDTSGTTSTRGTYVEIVGNGTANNARSNARTLDWNGNEELAGNLIAKGGKIGDGKNANYKLAMPNTTSWTADKTIATTDQIPTITINTTSGSESVSDGTNTLNFGSNAFTSTSYQPAFTTYTFTAADSGWSSADSDGFYTLTITSSKKPFVCYNLSGEQIMAGLKGDGTNITVVTDTKFAGSVVAF